MAALTQFQPLFHYKRCNNKGSSPFYLEQSLKHASHLQFCIPWHNCPRRLHCIYWKFQRSCYSGKSTAMGAHACARTQHSRHLWTTDCHLGLTNFTFALQALEKGAQGSNAKFTYSCDGHSKFQILINALNAHIFPINRSSRDLTSASVSFLFSSACSF